MSLGLPPHMWRWEVSQHGHCATSEHSAAMNSINKHVIKPESALGYLFGFTLIGTDLLFQVLPVRLQGLRRQGRKTTQSR